jgi:hypothetical protein
METEYTEQNRTYITIRIHNIVEKGRTMNRDYRHTVVVVTTIRNP